MRTKKQDQATVESLIVDSLEQAGNYQDFDWTRANEATKEARALVGRIHDERFEARGVSASMETSLKEAVAERDEATARAESAGRSWQEVLDGAAELDTRLTAAEKRAEEARAERDAADDRAAKWKRAAEHWREIHGWDAEALSRARAERLAEALRELETYCRERADEENEGWGDDETPAGKAYLDAAEEIESKRATALSTTPPEPKEETRGRSDD